MKKPSALLLMGFFIVSCAVTGRKAVNYQNIEARNKAWSAAVAQVKESPLSQSSYKSLVSQMKLINKSLDPLDESIIEVNAIKEKMAFNDANKGFLRTYQSDFSKVMQIFSTNEEKLKAKDWHAAVKQELANAETEMEQISKKFPKANREMKKRQKKSEREGKKHFKEAKRLRNKHRYDEAREQFKEAIKYNRDHAKSAEDSLAAMALHDQAEAKLKREGNQAEAKNLLIQGMKRDAENPNLDKALKDFVNVHLKCARDCERRRLFAAAAAEYWQASKYYSGKKQEKYEKLAQKNCKKAMKKTLLTLAVTTRDKGQFSKDTKVLVRQLQKTLKSGLKTITLKSGGVIGKVSNPSNTSPTFKSGAQGGADIAAGIAIRNIRIENYNTDQIPRSKPFVYCKMCIDVPNPKYTAARQKVDAAQSAVYQAQTAVNLAAAMRLNTSFAQHQLNNAQRILDIANAAMLLIPPTVRGDDVRQSTWMETKLVKKAIVEMEITFFSPSGAQTDIVTLTGEAEDSDMTIVPGEYFEKSGLRVKTASLKGDKVVKKLAFERAAKVIQENFLYKFGSGDISTQIVKQIPSDTSDPKNKNLAADMMIRLLLNSPGCSGCSDVQYRLNSLLVGYNVNEMIGKMQTAR